MTDAPDRFERSPSPLPSPLPWLDAPVVLLTACDRGYLPHALAFARSLDAVAPGHHLVIHLINPDPDAIARIEATAASLGRTRVHLSTEKVRLPPDTHKGAYYASARFLRMSEILNLRTAVPVLAVDADALAVAPLALDFSDKPEAEVCLRQRPGEEADAPHLHIAAGAVWARSTPRSRAFFDAVSADLAAAFGRGGADWFVDQAVLGHHVRTRTAEARVRNLKSKFADWSLREDAVLWMGKGERKYLDVRYVALRDAYDEDASVRASGELLLRRCRARMGVLACDRVIDRAFARGRSPARPRATVMLPRLDLPWKATSLRADGRAPAPAADTIELRLWWKRFTIALAHALDAAGAVVEMLELPAWEITPERVDACVSDLVFVPHRCALDFGPTRTARMFYMQQYLRQAFVVDGQGWGPAASGYPVHRTTLPPAVLGAWDAYRGAFDGGDLESKFAQATRSDPQRLRALGMLPEGPYVFVPLQVPHDQSIRYFSDVSMEATVDAALALARGLDQPLVLKAHPANRGSMREFEARYRGDGILWSEAHVHDLLASAEGVVTVNSGVGFEALLARRPVVCLGRADYDAVVHRAAPATLAEHWRAAVTEDPTAREVRYARFVDWFLGRYAVDLARPQTSAAVLRRIVANALSGLAPKSEPRVERVAS